MSSGFVQKIGKMFAGQAVAATETSATRSVAKDRLSVILASQRGSEMLQGVDMNALQQDVLKVVKVSTVFVYGTSYPCFELSSLTTFDFFMPLHPLILFCSIRNTLTLPKINPFSFK